MTGNLITLIVGLWILIGLFVDHKRNGYNYETLKHLGLVEETPARVTAFILAPFNLCVILIKKFIVTIFINKWQ